MTPTNSEIKQLLKTQAIYLAPKIQQLWNLGLSYYSGGCLYSDIEEYIKGYKDFPAGYEEAKDIIEYLRQLFESFKNTTGWSGYVPWSFAFDEYYKTVRINKRQLDATTRHICHVLKAEEKERTLTHEQFRKWSKKEAEKHWKKYIEPVYNYMN